MLRSCASLVGRSAALSVKGGGGAGAAPAGLAVTAGPLRVPVRRWNQCTHIISLPPRHPCTLQETLAHVAFMMIVWLLPTLVLCSQVKIWKRRYLQTT